MLRTLQLSGIAGWEEDDDGESYYDKINPAIRERNFIVMKPDGSGEYYKVASTLWVQLLFIQGTTIEAFQNGSPRRNENLLGEMAQAFVTSFSPISYTPMPQYPRCQVWPFLLQSCGQTLTFLEVT